MSCLPVVQTQLPSPACSCCPSDRCVLGAPGAASPGESWMGVPKVSGLLKLWLGAMNVKVALFPAARVHVAGEVVPQGGVPRFGSSAAPASTGQEPLGMGDRSTCCIPPCPPRAPSRAGISPYQEGAGQARPTLGQGEMCLEQRTRPFAIRSPRGSGEFVSARRGEEEPRSGSGSVMLLGDTDTRVWGHYPTSCPIPSARQWGLCPPPVSLPGLVPMNPLFPLGWGNSATIAEVPGREGPRHPGATVTDSIGPSVPTGDHRSDLRGHEHRPSTMEQLHHH